MNPPAQFLAACAYTTTTTTRAIAVAAAAVTTAITPISNGLGSNRRAPAVFTSYPVSVRGGVEQRQHPRTFTSRRSFVTATTPLHYHQQQQRQQSTLLLHRPTPSATIITTTTTNHPHRRTIMTTDLIESAKRAACQQAVAENFDPSFRYVGIGSGSTVAYVVEAIAAYGPAVTSGIKFIPSGSGSAQLVRNAGLSVLTIPELLASVSSSSSSSSPSRQYIDVYFDGADEVDPELSVIKGGGACLFQEKLVARLSRKFVCVADSRKRAPRLLSGWAYVPVEVSPVAAELVRLSLEDLGSVGPAVRARGPGAAPQGTDNGNLIIDAPFPPLLLAAAEADRADPAAGRWTPDALAAAIRGILGVLEVGIFAGPTGPQAAALGPRAVGVRPVKAYFGNADGGVETLG
ncbi:ribose 5-phosphate isomerase A-domain-containing protein [Biscogniauxia mediterranea]|nr:ribose 5-phosphate isomerase A-domain-containing protein [Biscogniauxia mediterranea]